MMKYVLIISGKKYMINYMSKNKTFCILSENGKGI
jgi:hypothetical protein